MKGMTRIAALLLATLPLIARSAPTRTPSASPTRTALPSPTVSPTATPTATPSPAMPNGFESPAYKVGDVVILTRGYSVSFAGDVARVVAYDRMTGVYTFDLRKNNVKFSVPSSIASSSAAIKP